MVKFLKAAFKISLFQILLISLFSTAKYVVNTYQMTSKIQRPFLWTCLALGIVLILTLSINGFIEKNSAFAKKWTDKLSTKQVEILKKIFQIGLIIPLATFCATLIYIITPTSVLTSIALLLGIIFRNIINYFREEKTDTIADINNGT